MKIEGTKCTHLRACAILWPVHCAVLAIQIFSILPASAQEIITSIAGNGTYGFSGDGSSARDAKLNYPWGVAIDRVGNVYVADRPNDRIREITASTNTAGLTLTLDRNAYCIGESWKLNIVNAPARAAIRLAGVLNSRPWSLPDWGITDQDGHYSASGTYVDGNQGTYQLYAEISGITSNTVFASVSNCDVWTPANSNLADRNIRALAVDPLDSFTEYAGTEAHGVFKSTNAGADWLPTGLKDAKVNVLAVDSSHPGTLYAGTDGKGLLKSTDSGATWSTVGPNIPNVSLLTIDPLNSGTLLAGYCNLADFGVMFRSTDGGESWTKIVLPSSWTQFMAIDPRNPNVLYLTDYGYLGMNDVGYLWKSTDGGKTWSSSYLHDIGTIWHLVVDPTESNTLYTYGYRFESLKSTDGGKTWIPYTLPIDTAIADPVNTGTLYAIAGGTLYRSTDSGGTWNMVRVGLVDVVQAVAVSRSNPEMVFAGTQAGGVYRNAAGPTLTLDRNEYCLDESWKLNIVDAPAGAAIRLVGVSNGVPWDWPGWGMTDQDGHSKASGTYVYGNQGTYQLYAEISGITSNTVFVSVSNCSGVGEWDY